MPGNQNNEINTTGFTEHESTDHYQSSGTHRDIAFDDLIERQPGWLLRSGIPLLFGTVILTVALASIIKYPDKLAAPFILTTENPPIDVVTLSGGQISAWYVADRQQVAKNEVLAYIDNTARLEDVETFAAFVEAVNDITHIPDHLKHTIPEDLQMGEMRQLYTTYMQTLTAFQHLLRRRIIFDKMSTLKDKTQKHRQLGQALERRLLLFEKELSLTEKDYDRNQQLLREGAISALEFEKNEAGLLQKQQQLENLKSAIIQNTIEIEQLNTQWLELKDGRATGVSDYLIKLDELYLQFRNEYSEWKKKYLVSAPIAGTLSITPGMVESRTIIAGDIIAGIAPVNAGDKVVARISPQAAGIGKIEKGSRVLLQLDAYPYKEFGAVETTITHVSLLPVQDKEAGLVYEIRCELPQPIISTTGKELAFRQKLTGMAQIITKDRSIMKRVLERLVAVQI